MCLYISHSQLAQNVFDKYIPQHNHWNIFPITEPNCQCYSNGNIGLLENKLDIEKGVIITIEQLVILMKFSSWASRVTERHYYERKSNININIHWFSASSTSSCICHIIFTQGSLTFCKKKWIFNKLTKRFKYLQFFITAGRTFGFVTTHVLAKGFQWARVFYHDNCFPVIRIVKKPCWPQRDIMISFKYHITPTRWWCTCSKKKKSWWYRQTEA